MQWFVTGNKSSNVISSLEEFVLLNRQNVFLLFNIIIISSSTCSRNIPGDSLTELIEFFFFLVSEVK